MPNYRKKISRRDAELPYMVREALGKHQILILSPKAPTANGFLDTRKSELGLQVLQRLEKFDFILWICASTEEAYEEDIINCALRLKDEYRRIPSTSGECISETLFSNPFFTHAMFEILSRLEALCGCH